MKTAEGTAEPGEAGNAVYYAHAQPGMFLGLYQMHLGDEIRVVRADGTHLVFHVTAFKTVPFNDRAALAQTPFEELTLRIPLQSAHPFRSKARSHSD